MKTANQVVFDLLLLFDEMHEREKKKLHEMEHDEHVTACNLAVQKAKRLFIAQVEHHVIKYAKKQLDLSEDTIFSITKGDN